MVCVVAFGWRNSELIIYAGKVRAIGVSNYTVGHLEELLHYATIKPHVLQVHFSADV